MAAWWFFCSLQWLHCTSIMRAAVGVWISLLGVPLRRELPAVRDWRRVLAAPRWPAVLRAPCWRWPSADRRRLEGRTRGWTRDSWYVPAPSPRVERAPPACGRRSSPSDRLARILLRCQRQYETSTTRYKKTSHCIPFLRMFPVFPFPWVVRRWWTTLYFLATPHAQLAYCLFPIIRSFRWRYTFVSFLNKR